MLISGSQSSVVGLDQPETCRKTWKHVIYGSHLSHEPLLIAAMCIPMEYQGSTTKPGRAEIQWTENVSPKSFHKKTLCALSPAFIGLLCFWEYCLQHAWLPMTKVLRFSSRKSDPCLSSIAKVAIRYRHRKQKRHFFNSGYWRGSCNRSWY